jgi:hypothetical protein
MILVTQGGKTERQEAQQYVEDLTVGNSKCIFWTMTSISEMEVVIPDNLHIINLGLLKDLTN